MATRARLTEQVKEYLNSREWTYDVSDNENRTMFKFPMNLKGVLGSMTEYVFVWENRIMCIAVPPLKAKKENYGNVVEYLTRANYGLNLGGFEFDYRDGEVRYRDCLEVHGEEAVREDIHPMVVIPINMMERYGDGLAKNILGFGNPEEDIAKAEGKTQ